MIDTRTLEVIELDARLGEQVASISRIMIEDRFTHCDGCGLSYLPQCDFSRNCPECGGEV